MNAITRCPACGTTYRVQRAQLSARGGKVRCGQCSTVFEGAACLIDEGPRNSREAGGELPAFLAGATPKRRYTAVWALLAVIALAGLAVQALYRFRTEISVLFPAARPQFVAACMALGCEVRLPRRPEMLSIESSDLQADLKRENVLRLTALVRNRAPFPQEPPLLELTLTDEQDSAVVRRVLHPTDYLGPRRAAEALTQGIGAGAELAVVLHFDVSRIRATGYRLYLFHP